MEWEGNSANEIHDDNETDPAHTSMLSTHSSMQMLQDGHSRTQELAVFLKGGNL